MGILLPGILLAYLSFRTVKDERVLVEKALEGRNIAFSQNVERVINRTRNTQLERLQIQLRQTHSLTSPDSLMLFAASLLEIPFIHSLIVQQGGEQVLPPSLAEIENEEIAPLTSRAEEIIKSTQQAWKQGDAESTLRNLHSLFTLESGFQGNQGLEIRYGFRLLEIKALCRLNKLDEVQQKTKPFILDLLRESGFINPDRRVFYLIETIGTVTALESLPKSLRDWLFQIHQQLGPYRINSEAVAKNWPESTLELWRITASDDTTAFPVRYRDGEAFLSIGYPWLDSDTRIVAKLNETIFLSALNAEFVENRKSTGREIDFRIIDAADKIKLTTDSTDNRPPEIEIAFSGDFPRWRLAILKPREGEVSELGRRRSALQWLLLSISLAGLLFGSAAVVAAVRNERRTVRLKTNFLSAVSHELKTPLTAIRMFAEMLESGRQREEEKRVRYARLIGEEAMRLQGMIEGILSLGRLEEGRAHLNFESVKPARIAREVVALMSGSFLKSNIRLTLNLDETAFVRADGEALRSIIQNLLENAHKYSHEGTEVTITVERRGPNIAIVISDQGVGIAKEDQKRIFDSFWRAGDEMTRKNRGSGLGLSIVKQIADAHQADIQVESKLGEGTKMVVLFPASEDTDE